uniref:Gas vesicle protein GvpC (20kDa) n=3 Tax=Planktothrix rubescens TaxID=59512 RepID=Q9RLF6_PLARU|nr:gas vesicle protein GvpC (20kDa) [Planktothrix rubescens]
MALKDKWQQDRIGRQQGVQERQQQVQTTLSLWQQERQNQASEFREDLEYRVRDLLANYQKQRLEARETLLEDLAIFRQTLYREVEEYLGELDILHQQMAAQLQQQLQQSRTERKDAVQKLFEDLGVFRAELQDYHLKLQQTVWGSSHRHSIKPQPTVNPGVPQPATLDQPQG